MNIKDLIESEASIPQAVFGNLVGEAIEVVGECDSDNLMKLSAASIMHLQNITKSLQIGALETILIEHKQNSIFILLHQNGVVVIPSTKKIPLLLLNNYANLLGSQLKRKKNPKKMVNFSPLKEPFLKL